MSNTITKARFFFESDVHSWLFNKYDNIDKKSFFDHCSFGYDIIDQPFYCAVSSDDGWIDIKVYVRSEMGAFLENPDLGIKFSTKGEKPQVTSNTGRLGGNPAELIMLFYKAAVILGMQIEENELTAEYAEMDTDEEGVVVTLNEETLAFERVSGKARPAMACTTLFGGVQMMRPYQNEIMDSWMNEMMPFEDQLEAAEEGDEDAMEAIAMAYLNGDEDAEVEQDPEKALYWFTKLAEEENAVAAFNVGLFYAKGFGAKRDFAKAVEWMEKAAEYGDDDGMAAAEKYRQTLSDLALAENGDADAQGRLAGFYMALAGSLDQAGTGDDYAESLKWAKKASDNGNGDGLWALALAYEHGRGVAKNQSIALEYYEHGAEIGHASSMHSLACYYLRGDVVEQNMKLGFELIIRAALLGNGLAMRDAGRCYQFGNGCMGSMKKAVAWYKKALEVIDDDELAQKTSHFEMMLGWDDSSEEEYFGEDSDRELTAEEQAFIDKIDTCLSDEVKALIANPDTAIASYIETLGNSNSVDDDDAEGDEDDDWAPPAGFMEAMEAFEEAEEYENELAKQGVLPDAPKPGNGVMSLSADGFPRVALKAEEGDEKALAIIAKMKAANGIE